MIEEIEEITAPIKKEETQLGYLLILLCLLFGSVVPKPVMQHSKFITNQSLLLKYTTSNDCVLTSLYPRLYIFNFLYRDVIYTLKTSFENRPESERQAVSHVDGHSRCAWRSWHRTQIVCRWSVLLFKNYIELDWINLKTLLVTCKARNMQSPENLKRVFAFRSDQTVMEWIWI